MTPEKLETAGPPLLGIAEARRLCIALIGAEQERLLREGRLERSCLIAARLAEPGAPPPDDLQIDEAALGLDSLSLLDVILAVNRYFGLAETGMEDYLYVRRRMGDWAELVAHHLERMGAGAEITFTTSGSTGPGKPIRQTRAALEGEVAAIADLLLDCVTPGGRILSMVAPQHIYGFLWACLLPRMTGLEVQEVGALAPTRLLRMAEPGDIVLGTPFTWAQVARAGGPLPQGVFGVSAGGPSTPETWAAVAQLDLARLIDVYGSTETGGVGVRGAEGAPFRLMGHMVRCGDGVARKCAPKVLLPLQDQLDWTGPDTFRVLGRKDSVVQIAGTNVNPGAVTQVLKAAPGVAEATVRLDTGRLKAFVVPSDTGADIGALETALRECVAQALSAPARPDQFTFGDALPRNAVGKLADW